jgi:hypothetical protein
MHKHKELMMKTRSLQLGGIEVMSQNRSRQFALQQFKHAFSVQKVIVSKSNVIVNRE